MGRLERPLGGGARGALVAVGLAWGLWAMSTVGDGPTPAEIGADLLVGLLMQWVGVATWGRPGTGRTGALMYGAGLLWFVGSIWTPPPVGSITFAWRSWYEPVFLVIVLGWATGHLRRPVDRILVGALGGAFLVRSLTRMFLFDGAAVFDDPAWANPFSVAWNRQLWDVVEYCTFIVSAVVGIAVAVTCVARWARATGPARRTLTPILVAGLGLVPLMGWTAFTNQFVGVLLPELPGEFVFWSQMILRALFPIAILVGIYRLGTNRALTDLLVALNRGVPAGGLEDALRRALRDPSLRLVFARADGEYVDEIGRPASLPGAGSSSGVTAIATEEGEPVALLVHDPALLEDPDLLEAAGAAARLRLDNARLQAEVRAQLEEVRASRARLVEASDAERRRVERDLHDGAQQRLVTLALQLQQARERAATPDRELVALLDDASGELDLAIGELRELARGIHPAVLSRAGLGPAVTSLAERCPIPVSVSVPGERYPPAVESAAYFVVAEALTNVIRYSSAGTARVVAERRNGTLLLEINDDGSGGADPVGGSGLSGLQDRVAAVGGQLEVDSPRGVGTTVRASLPCG